MVSDALEHIAPQGRFKGNVPLSLAVKDGKHVFVFGVPGYDFRAFAQRVEVAAKRSASWARKAIPSEPSPPPSGVNRSARRAQFFSEMADRAGFEPAVAVTPRTLSKRVP